MEQQRTYMSVAQAAHQSGLSGSYITLLLRGGKLEGFQLVREWVVYTDSLTAFLTTPRKPGPKGPRVRH